MGTLKAVGLLSGGKDSIFAMHYARELGHSICAVATLLPRGDAIETDSYMYQSVGTHMTAAIAKCLGVPHFSAQVNGQPILTETLNYKHTAGDEVEDLCALLLRVKVSADWLRQQRQYSPSPFLLSFFSPYWVLVFRVLGEHTSVDASRKPYPIYKR